MSVTDYKNIYSGVEPDVRQDEILLTSNANREVIEQFLKSYAYKHGASNGKAFIVEPSLTNNGNGTYTIGAGLCIIDDKVASIENQTVTDTYSNGIFKITITDTNTTPKIFGDSVEKYVITERRGVASALAASNDTDLIVGKKKFVISKGNVIYFAPSLIQSPVTKNAWTSYDVSSLIGGNYNGMLYCYFEGYISNTVTGQVYVREKGTSYTNDSKTRVCNISNTSASAGGELQSINFLAPVKNGIIECYFSNWVATGFGTIGQMIVN